jgi:UDP-N-acetylglucosamine acyltransferase
VTNNIHPTAVIGDEVSIGDGNFIGAYAVITGRVAIGDSNWIGPHVTIGSPPEHLDFHSPGSAPRAVAGSVIVGSECVIHEFTSIQSPTVSDTVIGDEVFIMTGAYVAHDVVIRARSVISAHVLMAGHVEVGERATIGMGAAIHQRVSIGPLSMVGMNSSVTRNVPPFMVAYGSPANVARVNIVGLERAGISADPWLEELAKPFEEWDVSKFPEALKDFLSADPSA